MSLSFLAKFFANFSSAFSSASLSFFSWLYRTCLSFLLFFCRLQFFSVFPFFCSSLSLFVFLSVHSVFILKMKIVESPNSGGSCHGAQSAVCAHAQNRKRKKKKRKKEKMAWLDLHVHGKPFRKGLREPQHRLHTNNAAYFHSKVEKTIL